MYVEKEKTLESRRSFTVKCVRVIKMLCAVQIQKHVDDEAVRSKEIEKEKVKQRKSRKRDDDERG